MKSNCGPTSGGLALPPIVFQVKASLSDGPLSLIIIMPTLEIESSPTLTLTLKADIPGSDGMPGENAPPCTKDKCLAEKLTTCVDVIARPNHKKGYWQCPTDHVITGFKNTGQYIKNMLVTCCKV